MKLSILIPVFNEEQTIGQVLEQILTTPLPVGFELVIVDDDSSDRTFDVAQRVVSEYPSSIPTKLIRNSDNQGKGKCILQALELASGDYVLVQDGDLEYSPTQIPLLLEPILEEQARIVYGSRFLERKWPKGMRGLNYFANRFLTWFTNRLFGLRLTDMETCYKVLQRDLLRSFCLQVERFEFEPAVSARIAKRKIAIREVPIAYQGRCRGKKIKAQDFWAAIGVLLKERFVREPVCHTKLLELPPEVTV